MFYGCHELPALASSLRQPVKLIFLFEMLIMVSLETIMIINGLPTLEVD